MKVTILGAGAWGTALACSVAACQPVHLWGRDAQQAEAMARDRENVRYLPGHRLPEGLKVSADWAQALAHGRDGVYVVATPMAGLREMLRTLPDDSSVWWLCKGFEKGTGALGHEIAREVAPAMRVGVLSGPSFAAEVARGQPTALVAASHDADLAAQAIDAFHGDNLRVYTSDDPVGVEVGGAVKNVLAIATGIADGMSLGLNARAALVTRGLAEITRLGVALGARPETFMGLSGLGDLVLTATGDLSRNRQVGLRLAAGLTLPEVLQALGHVAEGVYSARTVLDRAVSLGVDMPLTDAVVAVLDGRLTPQQAVAELMGREPKPEAL